MVSPATPTRSVAITLRACLLRRTVLHALLQRQVRACCPQLGHKATPIFFPGRWTSHFSPNRIAQTPKQSLSTKDFEQPILGRQSRNSPSPRQVDELNNDCSIHGILTQLRMPAHIAERNVLPRTSSGCEAPLLLEVRRAVCPLRSHKGGASRRSCQSAAKKLLQVDFEPKKLVADGRAIAGQLRRRS